MSVTKVVVFTRSASVQPAAASALRRFSPTCYLRPHVAWADDFTRFVARELPGDENQPLSLHYDDVVVEHMAPKRALKQRLRLDLLRRHNQPLLLRPCC